MHVYTGVGVYVSSAQYYAGRQAAQPNNTYLSVYSQSRPYYGYYSSYYSSRFIVYCCSNVSSSSNIGSFTDPVYGGAYTSNFNALRVERYSWTSAYAGCIRLEGYTSYDRHSLSYNPGVYTCNIPDATGQTQRVNFALYNQNSKKLVYYH